MIIKALSHSEQCVIQTYRHLTFNNFKCTYDWPKEGDGKSGIGLLSRPLSTFKLQSQVLQVDTDWQLQGDTNPLKTSKGALKHGHANFSIRHFLNFQDVKFLWLCYRTTVGICHNCVTLLQNLWYCQTTTTDVGTMHFPIAGIVCTSAWHWWWCVHEHAHARGVWGHAQPENFLN